MYTHKNLALSRLAGGRLATVTGLSTQGPMRRRFQDLGIIPGTVVECLGPSPLGDPVAYLIRGAVIALRKQDAQAILVDACDVPQPRTLPLGSGQKEAGYGAF